MASEELSKTEAVIDSAIGPFVVETREVRGFNIEDHVQNTIESQAIHLQIRTKVENVDPEYTKNRTPVVSGDLAVGGFDA